MKKIILTLITSAMVTAAIPAMAADDEIKIYLDEQQLQFDVAPIIIDGTTLVPMRAIFEALGAEVEWNGNTQTVMAYAPGVVIQLPIGDTVIYRNTIEQTIEVPAQLHDERTLVPIRIVSEYMGCDVEWEENTRSIYITPTNDIQVLNWNDNLYYIGQTVNYTACGYGALYSRTDDSVVDIGEFYSTQILKGTRFFDDGAYFVGDFVVNETDGGKMAYGTYYVGNSAITGDFSNNLTGYFTVMDLTTGHEEVKYYVNGSVHNPEAELAKQEVETREQTLAQMNQIQSEIQNLLEQKNQVAQAKFDFVNQDIFSTDRAKAIYKEIVGPYEYDSDSDALNSINIDSFAAANARRQKEASLAKAQEQATKLILEDHEAQLKQFDNLIESYEAQIKDLQALYIVLSNAYYGS